MPTRNENTGSWPDPVPERIVKRYRRAGQHPFSRFKGEFRQLDLMFWFYWTYFALSGFLLELLFRFSPDSEVVRLWHLLIAWLPIWSVIALTALLSALNVLVIFPVAHRKGGWRGLSVWLVLLLSALPLFGELVYSLRSTTTSGKQVNPDRSLQPKFLPLGLFLISQAHPLWGKISLSLVTNLNLGWSLLLLFWLPAGLDHNQLETLGLVFRVLTGMAFLAYLVVSHLVHPQQRPWRTWLGVFAPVLLISHSAVLLGFFLLAWFCFPTRVGAATSVQKGFRGTYRFSEALTSRGGDPCSAKVDKIPTFSSSMPQMFRTGTSPVMSNPFWIKRPFVLFEAAGLLILYQERPFVAFLLLLILVSAFAVTVFLRLIAATKSSAIPIGEIARTLVLAVLGFGIALLISGRDMRALQILLVTWALVAFYLHLITFKQAVLAGRMASWGLVMVTSLLTVFACKFITYPPTATLLAAAFQAAAVLSLMLGPLWIVLNGRLLLRPFSWHHVWARFIPGRLRFRWFLSKAVLTMPLGGLVGPLLWNVMELESPAFWRLRLIQVNSSQPKGKKPRNP